MKLPKKVGAGDGSEFKKTLHVLPEFLSLVLNIHMRNSISAYNFSPRGSDTSGLFGYLHTCKSWHINKHIHKDT